MDTSHAPTWWEAEHASLCEMAADPSGQWADADPPFSDALLALLAAVEAAFAVTGTDTPPWPDPHLGLDGQARDSLEEEYSRCLDPGKHRILRTRAEAWAEVLTARGWATRVESEGADLRSGIRWATPPRLPLHRTTVLRPRRPGAQALVLARTAPEHAMGSSDLAGADAQILGLEIGMGEPAVPVSTVPDCGCDACDSGSRDLLEDLDRTLLSIVDGSFEVELAPGWTSHRTSFGAGSGSGDDGADLSLTVSARPWAETWMPRPLSPAIDPHDAAWAEEMFAEGPVTAPLDALDHPPAGYRRDHRSTVVTGMDFDGAASALRCWAVHRRAGLQVRASHTPLREGAEVHLRPGLGPLRLTAPCRVLWLLDEPDRQGFAYGTLPGHPESGIEQFTVTRTATGLVRFHLDVVSRPATWYARLGAPISRLAQELFTRRYLRALSVPAKSTPSPLN